MNLLQTFLGSPLIHRFGCALLHFSWQGLLIAVILAVAMRMLRGRPLTGTEAQLWSRWSAAARYLTAWAALLAMAVSVPITAWLVSPPLLVELAGGVAGPPAAESPADSAASDAGPFSPDGIGELQIPAAAAIPVESPATALDGASGEEATVAPLAVRASQWIRPALPWVVCCWVVGTVALAIWRLAGWIGLRRLCCLGTRPASEAAGQMLQRLMTRLRIPRAVRLLESTLVEVPTVIGWLRPVILLPASVLSELPADQLELILAHELAHIRRHDFLWNLLQTAIETLLFYHPAVWWVSRQIRIEREACCDEMAVAGYPLGSGDRLLYARALTRLEELRHGPAGLLPARIGVAANGAPLLGRIRRVLGLPGNDDEGRRTWLVGSIGVLLLLGVLVGYAATAGEPQSKPAEIDVRAAGASGSREPEKPRYAGEGLVVDDQTGKPVEQIAVQEGVPNPSAELGIMWITAIQSARGVRGGRFDIPHGWVKDGKVRIRIVADGYLPEVAIVDTEHGLLKAPLVMRLRRGQAIRGRVIDHAGKAVAGAEVFLGGHDRHVEIVDGKPEGFGGKPETTGTDGRFVIHGAAPGELNRLIVLAPGLHVWMVPVVELGKELTVKLPEPATLVLHYDIPGDVAEGRFRVELKTWDMPDWKGIVSSVQNPTAKNQGEVILKSTTPGVYDVIRMKQLRVADRGTEAFCDRRDVTLESGKTTTLRFVRKKAFPIEGDLVGLEATGIPGAFVFVRSPKATGDPESREDWKLPIYDGATSGTDGKFKTAPIEPGEYLLVADAYEPQPPGMGFGLGWPLPAYVGKAKVTVPQDGPPPRVRIEMKPRPAQRKTAPKAPAGPVGAGSQNENRERIQVPENVTVSGKVVGPDGKPLAGVPLSVDCIFGRGRFVRDYCHLESDEHGRFKIDHLPPGDIFIRYEKSQNETLQGAGDARLFISHVRAKDGEQVKDVMVDLSQAKCVLEGQVVDYEGNGIANASVKATFAASASRLAHYAWARTDRDGRFRIGGLPPHEFLVSASTKNHYGGLGERVKLEMGETKTLRLLGYLPGYPAPEPKPDDPRWGKPAGDLRAAIELRPTREAYSIGDTVEVRPVLCNPGKKTVTLIHDFALAAELHVADENGNVQTFSYKGFLGDTVRTTYVLDPAKEVEMQGSIRLKLVGADSAEDLIQSPGTPLAFALKCRPGAKYTLSYDLGGGLRTGEASIIVKD